MLCDVISVVAELMVRRRGNHGTLECKFLSKRQRTNSKALVARDCWLLEREEQRTNSKALVKSRCTLSHWVCCNAMAESCFTWLGVRFGLELGLQCDGRVRFHMVRGKVWVRVRVAMRWQSPVSHG